MLLHQQLQGFKLILASQSPRRKTLLDGLDIPFEVIVREDVHEEFPAGLTLFEIPELLAQQKSEHYLDLLNDNTLVLTADTIVWHNEQVLGKPVDVEDAKYIIGRLSGSMHHVVTGVCIRSK
jgi:septum formation protein